MAREWERGEADGGRLGRGRWRWTGEGQMAGDSGKGRTDGGRLGEWRADGGRLWMVGANGGRLWKEQMARDWGG